MQNARNVIGLCSTNQLGAGSHAGNHDSVPVCAVMTLLRFRSPTHRKIGMTLMPIAIS